tara:strand:- start:136 stop:270 length:135 start_codon:yes stop_codon:yes gene_type:complete
MEQFQQLNPVFFGTMMEQWEQWNNFNDLAFARGATLLGYWYRIV